MSKINKIRVSGNTYSIEDLNAAKSVTLTQAEYDALVSAGTVDANTFYVISDSEFSMDDYWTSAETQSAITQATSGLQETLSAGTGIDITDNVISVTGGGGGGGDVTTNTDQDITGVKTFVGEKKIKFKQSTDSNKLGFTLYNSASTNNELGSFELRPNTFTIDNVQHPLMYFGHYRNTSVANAGVPQTVIGFRQYDQSNSAAYHLLAPLPEKAKKQFSLTTSFQDFYMPLGIKVSNSATVKADDTGVVDISSYIGGGSSYSAGTGIDITNDVISVTGMVATSAVTSAVTSGSTDVVESGAVYDQLGGLKLVKLTQTQYDNLSTKDSNTLYVIVN